MPPDEVMKAPKRHNTLRPPPQGINGPHWERARADLPAPCAARQPDSCSYPSAAGHSVRIGFQNAEGHADRVPGLVAELVRLKADVIRRQKSGSGTPR